MSAVTFSPERILWTQEQEHTEPPDSFQETKQQLVDALLQLEQKKKHPPPRIQEALNALTPPQLNTLIEALVESIPIPSQEQSGVIDLCCRLLSSEQIQNLAQNTFTALLSEDTADPFAIDDLAQLLAHHLPPPTQSHLKTTKPGSLRRLADKLHRALDHMYSVFAFSFGLSERSDSPTSSWQAAMQLTQYKDIVLFPITLLAVLIPLCGSPLIALAIIVSLFVTFTVALIIHHHCFKQPPSRLHYCENWTEKAKEGEFSPVLHRDIEIEKVLHCLANSTNPLLIGNSQVGKTETLKGVAQRIAADDVPKALQGKRIQLFSVHTAACGDPRACVSPTEKMQIILEEIKGYEGKIILFFDELQALCGESPNNALLYQFLKPRLTPGPQQIHIAAAITSEDFKNYVEKDIAFTNRFQKIPIENFSDEKACSLLHNFVNDKFPRTLVSDAAIQKAVELSQENSTDANLSKAQELLSKAIETQQTSEPPELTGLKAEYEQIRAENLSNPRALLHRLKEKQQQIRHIEAALQEEDQLLDEIEKLRKLHKYTQLQRYETARALACDEKQAQAPSLKLAYEKTLLFNHYYLLPLFEHLIDKKAEQCHLHPARLDLGSGLAFGHLDLGI